MEKEYPVFTEEMKKTHTILVPDMLPIHFNLIIKVLERYGYKAVLLRNSAHAVKEEGLKNVHNDTCYPALLVIGQFLDALKSGKYDPNTTALLISQTGGGCRASNYLHLLRKALEKDFPQIPVISLNFSGLGSSPGFKITLLLVLKLLKCVIYGDLMMLCYNQCKPYELNEGDADRALEECNRYLEERLENGGFGKKKKIYKKILSEFGSVKCGERNKPRVGIVGEIYVKYSPLANNDLEKFLIREGCEPVVPGLMDFVMYCIVNNINDKKLYGRKSLINNLSGILYKYLLKMTRKQNKLIKKHGVFRQGDDFEELRAEADKLIHQGVKMGEGWLITAEMGCLVQSGTKNIVCTQPFGCLPNHIVAKGMSRKVKEHYPSANIVAIDYDPSATSVNQENRLKLMLSLIQKQNENKEIKQ